MFPQATASSPAARRIASSMPVVVVLPLVPVTASHVGGSGSARPDPPGQLRLADHRDAGRRGGGDQRVVGPAARDR